MATRERKRLNRRTIVAIQVYSFLAGIFLVGLIAGLVIGRLTAPAVKTEAEDTQPTQIVTETAELPTIETVAPTVAYYDVPLSEGLQEYIFFLCESENVPVPLVLAMIEKESAFDASAISRTNDYGLMQINKMNHEWLSEEYGVTDFLDPFQNVYCGIEILSDYLSTYEGDVNKALMAYNMGEYGASKLWNKGITSSSYSESVVALMAHYEGGGQ